MIATARGKMIEASKVKAKANKMARDNRMLYGDGDEQEMEVTPSTSGLRGPAAAAGTRNTDIRIKF